MIKFDDSEILCQKNEEGNLNGQGEKKMKDGNIFKGEFQNGKIIKGKLIFKNGNCYEGDFNEKFQFHGKGHFIWINGDQYEGEYQNNYKEGIGKIFFKNGTFYEGFFKKGKVHGKGLTILLFQYSQTKGVFKDDKGKDHKTVFQEGKRKWTKDEIKRLKCNKSHWLVKIGPTSGHRCDVCSDGRQSMITNGMWRCAQCDFDRCLDCFNSFR